MADHILPDYSANNPMLNPPTPISQTTGLDTSPEGSTFWQANKGNILTGIVKGISNFFTSIAGNRRRRKQAETDYQQQRADALADWNRQNEYDHPMQQMQRLKEAGLNPHLVYGNGAVGNTSSNINNVRKDSANNETPQINTDSMYNYIDLEAKKAQIDLLKEQKDLISQDIIYRAVQTANTSQQTMHDQFNLGLKQQTEPETIEFARENLRKLKLEMGLAVNSDERAAKLNNAQIQQIKSNIVSQGYDIEFKRLENVLQQAGIYKTDPIYLRFLLQAGDNPNIITKITQSITNLGKEAISSLF